MNGAQPCCALRIAVGPEESLDSGQKVVPRFARFLGAACEAALPLAVRRGGGEDAAS